MINWLKATMIFLLITLCLTGCGAISDGDYTASVTLTGGSGRAYIESPCRITVKNGEVTADIIWSSKNYDYMIVDGKTYTPVNTEGNSEFIIPVSLDKDIPVQADTVAMSTPHLIDYTIRFSLIKDGKTAENNNTDEQESVVGGQDLSAPEITGLKYLSTDKNDFANCFAIHRYSDDLALISVDDGRKYLIIPENYEIDELIKNLPEDVIPLCKPLDSIYLASSNVMCQFDAIDSVNSIILSGIESDDWYIDTARQAMEDGQITYGGKYSAPDYELMVSSGIDLAIENTMILHVPKVREKIEKLGIPVFIDRSSYETEPLGRCEWIKVYGLITGKEASAEDAFASQKSLIDNLSSIEPTGKKIAIFSVNSNHQILTRRKNDYFAKMVEIAGGTYLAPDEEASDKSNSQQTISTEDFYAYADKADILIYNATIESAPDSLQELMDKDTTFSNFDAFKSGNVYFTDKSLYQYADKTGTIISDLSKIINVETEDTGFFHKLK